MGEIVLVLGKSGSGKSASLRNFPSGSVGVFECAGKRLPFRSDIPVVKNAKYQVIKDTLRKNNLHAYVVDDAGYLMQFDNFAYANVKGYDKFVQMAQSFEQLLRVAAEETDDDTIVYFLMHPEENADGTEKVKTIGRMLDEKLCVEGLFNVVLDARVNDDGHVFLVQNDGTGLAKTPMGMFEGTAIDNDLAAVDSTIREYYGMKAL